jgi:hypothetical protein
MRRLHLTELDTELALGGGMLMARNPLLNGGVTTRVLAEVPTARISVVDVPPIAGAALLGLDHLGLDRSAQDRLRAQYMSLGSTVAGWSHGSVHVNRRATGEALGLDQIQR